MKLLVSAVSLRHVSTYSIVFYLIVIVLSIPRHGHEVICTRKTRTAFKLAMRYCRQHGDQLRADTCANSLESKDSRKFWNSIYEVSNNTAKKYASIVDGAVGDHDIASC